MVFLGFLSRELPGLFTEGTEYDVDLFRFLLEQQLVIERLGREPAYAESLEKRKPLLEIDISRRTEAKGTAYLVVRPAIRNIVEKRWEELVANPEEAYEHNRSKAVRDVETLKEKYPDLNFRGALIGLISLLPQADRAKFFRMTPSEKIQKLRSNPHIADITVQMDRFRFSDVGLNPMDPTALLALLTEAEAVREQARKHVLLAATADVLRKNSKTSASSQTSRKPSPEEFLIELFSFFFEVKKEPDAAMHDTLDALFLRKPETSRELASDLLLGQTWREIEEDALEKISGDDVPQIRPVLRLKEVPGYLATLRGFVGVDCSTQYSFPYGLLPQERTFFVLNEENTVLGYAMATELFWNGKPAIYLHDLSGPRITRSQVRYIVAGLMQTVQKLGVEILVLPTKGVSHRNINFKHIREEIDRIAAEGTNGSLTYADNALRQTLAGISELKLNHGFDSADKNEQGHALTKYAQDGMVVETREIVWPEVETNPLSLSESLLLALEVDAPSWSPFAKGALQAALKLTTRPNGVDLQRRNAAYQLAATTAKGTFVDTMARLLPNPSGESGVAFLNQVREILAAEGLEIQQLFAGHSHLLYPGILMSSDVFQSASADANRLAMEALRTVLLYRDQSELVRPALKANLKKLEKQVEFKQLIRDLVRDRHENLETLNWLQGEGLDVALLTPSLTRLQELGRNSGDSETRASAMKLVDGISAKLLTEPISCPEILTGEH